jgi:class 3 adenylate cyclase
MKFLTGTPVVNRTARMVDLAEAGEVLLSDVMLERVWDVEVSAARRARVKGVSDLLIVYRLLGLRGTREPRPEPPADAEDEQPVLSA